MSSSNSSIEAKSSVHCKCAHGVDGWKLGCQDEKCRDIKFCVDGCLGCPDLPGNIRNKNTPPPLAAPRPHPIIGERISIATFGKPIPAPRSDDQHSIFEQMIEVQETKTKIKVPDNGDTSVLVLFHTKGSYNDDWEPMTPIGNTSNFKWNGQNFHRDDHLMTSHGKNALIVCRDKKNSPFTFYGTIENITHEDVLIPKGTPRRFTIKNINIQSTFNGVFPNDPLPRCNGMAWMKSALHNLGLQHVSGNHLGGIQLCSKI
jgi:hypothetical protein